MLHSALYDDAGKLVLRLTLGVLMLFHGIAKLGNGGSLNWIAGQLSDVGLPGFIAYAAEIVMRTEHGGYALELHAFYTFTARAVGLTGSGRFAVKPD